MDSVKKGVSRRNFIRNSAFAATGFYIMPHRRIPFKKEFTVQPLTRDLNGNLLVNQVGYAPLAGKFCIAKGNEKRKFDVLNMTNEVVYTGFLEPKPCDFGEYLVGDFSKLNKEGRFYIKSDTSRSYPFNISNSVYQPVINLIVHYFSLQRCGASRTGYLSPCHLDDGIRIDNGKHQDVTGGWHDACDLRKWVDATIYGMIGLARAYELQGKQNDEAVLDELFWGNQYFLKMQEPEGFVMNFIGGDVKQHSDSNRWTDNIIEQGEGDPELVTPASGKSMTEMLVFNSSDDRVIQTEPVKMQGQYNFITAEALMARITKYKDPDYSQKCLKASTKCFEWCTGSNQKISTGILGSALQASIELYKTTNQDKYKSFAIEQASQLKKLQVNNNKDNISGFFQTSPSDDKPYKNIWQGCQAFISLCDLEQAFPMHKDVNLWKNMIANYANRYLLMISKRNSFGIIPYGLYTKEDPGGNKKIGNYWYRYFMQPELDWWVGINSNIASAGIGLIKAGNILKDKKLKTFAQQQLDWIIGVNPFSSSTIMGVGYNHPKLFINGGEFWPPTPLLPGAVMNGLGGDKADQPFIGDGNWQVSEYWTPMVAHTLWLMAEISKDNNSI